MAESPLSLLLPAMGRRERSERLRMIREESQKASRRLIAGAACSWRTLEEEDE